MLMPWGPGWGFAWRGFERAFTVAIRVSRAPEASDASGGFAYGATLGYVMSSGNILLAAVACGPGGGPPVVHIGA